MVHACSRCQSPLVPGAMFCHQCGMQFPQPVPMADIGKGQPATKNQQKIPWPIIWRVFVGIIALSALIAGTKGDVAGSAGFVAFALILIWFTPEIKTLIKQRLSSAIVGIGIALAIYSYTPAGKAAYVSYKHDQLEAGRQTNSAPMTDTPKPPAPVVTKTDQPVPVENTGATLRNAGDEGYLSSDNPTLTLAADEDTFNSADDAARANDSVGLKQLLETGKLYSVDNHTRAKLLDVKFPGISKVRIESGPHTDEIGWIASDCLKQGNP